MFSFKKGLNIVMKSLTFVLVLTYLIVSQTVDKLLIFTLGFSVVTQPSPSVSQPSTSQSEEKAPELPKPKKNRCFMCRKKVGLTGIQELLVTPYRTSQS